MGTFTTLPLIPYAPLPSVRRLMLTLTEFLDFNGHVHNSAADPVFPVAVREASNAHVCQMLRDEPFFYRTQLGQMCEFYQSVLRLSVPVSRPAKPQQRDLVILTTGSTAGNRGHTKMREWADENAPRDGDTLLFEDLADKDSKPPACMNSGMPAGRQVFSANSRSLKKCTVASAVPKAPLVTSTP
ncbi:hypothetical protein MRX96_052416 [Rhipicephalus microplus]